MVAACSSRCYVHNNPVEARLVRTAKAYEWSSHRHYLSRAARPDWLEVETLLAPFGGDRPKGRRHFDAYVAERAPDEVRKALRAKRWSPVLGDEAFLESWSKRMRQRGLIAPEVPRAAQIHVLRPEEIVAAATRVFDVTNEELLQSVRGQRNLPRAVALLACHELCPATNAEVGAVFGVTGSTVAAHASRARVLIQDERAHATAWKKLRAELERILAGGRSSSNHRPDL